MAKRRESRCSGTRRSGGVGGEQGLPFDVSESEKRAWEQVRHLKMALINSGKLDQILMEQVRGGDADGNANTPPQPRLVQVGDSFVDPNDVSAIQAIKSRPGLFVVRLKSQPDAEWPIWAEEDEIQLLLREFNLVTL